MIGPVLEKLADEYAGKFKLAKVNLTDSQSIANQYGIMSIPAVKMFKKGEIVDGFIGAQPEQNIRNWLEKNLEEK